MKTQSKVLAATIATILYSSTTFAENHIQHVVDGKVSQTWVLEKEAGALSKNSTNTKLTIDNIPGYLSGQAAIDSFSPEEFEALADKQGVTEEFLKEQFLNDPSLKVDANGMLLYMDEGANDEHDHGSKPVVAMDAPAGTDLYKLHSKPNAKRVIYLDFTGPVVNDTAWLQGAVIQAVPYTKNIYAIWQAVSDDFSGFDVDITTERPTDENLYRSDFYDENFGMTVVISDSYDMGVCYGLCGGVAYIGTYDMVNNKKYQPAWVFAKSYPEADAVRYLSNTISHETGHTLGLFHKGVGPHEGFQGTEAYYEGRYHKRSAMTNGWHWSSWAPIMGKAYYSTLGQWSDGNYFWSNNRQGDIELINKMIPLVGDDGFSTKETATTLPVGSVVGKKVNIAKTVGNITSSTDVDFYTFTVDYAESEVDLLITNCIYTECTTIGTNFDAGNLHIAATLYNESGDIVQEYETLSNNVRIMNSLTPGKYYVAIKGGSFTKKITDEYGSEQTFKSNNDYDGWTNYGSIGQYTITGSYTTTPAPVDPTAVIDVSKTSGVAPVTISFRSNRSDPGNSEIVQWTWTFGDGRSSDEANPTITYEHSGTYLVSLAVKSKAGLYGYKNMTITVTEPAPPPPAVVYTGGSTSVKKLVMKATTTATSYKPYVIVTLKNSKTKIDNASIVTGKFTGTLSKIGAFEIKATSVYNKKAKRMEVVFPKRLAKKMKGTITFTVESITPANTTIKYDATLNEVTSAVKTF